MNNMYSEEVAMYTSLQASISQVWCYITWRVLSYIRSYTTLR